MTVGELIKKLQEINDEGAPVEIQIDVEGAVAAHVFRDELDGVIISD